MWTLFLLFLLLFAHFFLPLHDIMRKYLFIICIICATIGLHAQERETPNAKQARRMFMETYNMVYGQQGSQLHYKVNIIGIYKTEGTIWTKGKKSKFTDERIDAWNDGVTHYSVYRKKKVIEVYDANSDKRDKYASKFKFTLDDFDYSMERVNAGIMITLKQRRGSRGTVKQAKALIDAQTYAPILVKVKVSLFWANIKISNFKSGGISDDIFVFPAANYGSDYKYDDRR